MENAAMVIMDGIAENVQNKLFLKLLTDNPSPDRLAKLIAFLDLFQIGKILFLFDCVAFQTHLLKII